MAYIIWLDEDGNAKERHRIHRGRPIKGSHKDEDGNWIVPYSEKRLSPKYVIISRKNKVLKSFKKGRGRPKPGFRKVKEGEFAGDWVKIVA